MIRIFGRIDSYFLQFNCALSRDLRIPNYWLSSATRWNLLSTILKAFHLCVNFLPPYLLIRYPSSTVFKFGNLASRQVVSLSCYSSFRIESSYFAWRFFCTIPINFIYGSVLKICHDLIQVKWQSHFAFWWKSPVRFRIRLFSYCLPFYQHLTLCIFQWNRTSTFITSNVG